MTVHTQKYFLKSYHIKPKSDCICHAPIDLEQQTGARLLFQINRCMASTIWLRFDMIRFRKYFSVCSSFVLWRWIFSLFHPVQTPCRMARLPDTPRRIFCCPPTTLPWQPTALSGVRRKSEQNNYIGKLEKFTHVFNFRIYVSNGIYCSVLNV